MNTFQHPHLLFNKFKKIAKLKLKAFSLLEIAISLMIIGVLTMAVIQGQFILRSARLDKTAMQIEAIQLNVETARTNGIEINSIDDLIASGLMSNKQIIPAIGGQFFIKKKNHEPEGDYILLASNAEQCFLNKKDAAALKYKIDGTNEFNIGSVHIKNERNTCSLYIELV